MHAALTEVEQVLFHEMVDLLAGLYSNARPALMRASLDGRDVAVVVALQHEDGDMVRADPVAVLVDEDLLGRLVPPDPVEIVSAAGR